MTSTSCRSLSVTLSPHSLLHSTLWARRRSRRRSVRCDLAWPTYVPPFSHGYHVVAQHLIGAMALPGFGTRSSHVARAALCLCPAVPIDGWDAPGRAAHASARAACAWRARSRLTPRTTAREVGSYTVRQCQQYCQSAGLWSGNQRRANFALETCNGEASGRAANTTNFRTNASATPGRSKTSVA